MTNRVVVKSTVIRIAVVVLTTVVLLSACGKKSPEDSRRDLPLPPYGESCVANKRYYQVEFGFSLPVPDSWFSFASGEDWNQLVRFSDPARNMNAGVFAEWLPVPGKFDLSAWLTATEEAYAKKEIQAKRLGKQEEWPVAGGKWIVTTYELKDPVKQEWVDSVCVLHRDDLLMWSHAVLPRKMSTTDKGKGLLKQVRESLEKVEWYRPIGPKGVSPQYWELLRFSDRFASACGELNAGKVVRFFDETCPDRDAFISWYRKTAALVKKGQEGTVKLDVVRTGMVIQEKEATLEFEFTRTEAGTKTLKERRAFRLSKAEGEWEIVGRVERKK